MTSIERQHRHREPLRHGHERCIGEPNGLIVEPFDDLPGPFQIAVAQRLSMQHSADELIEKRTLGLSAESLQNQEIGFRQHHIENQERTWVRLDRSLHTSVVGLATIQSREQSAGVEEDHERPKPSSSSSWSTRRAAPPSRERPTGRRVRRGLLDRKLSRDSRMIDASVSPLTSAYSLSRRFRDSSRYTVVRSMTTSTYMSS